MIIHTTDELKALCQRLATYPFITVDTEFLREFTFYPKLCLIQVASSDEAVAIDPLSKEIDLTPFYDLLQNEKIVKVFHSARQDVENFYFLTKKIPTPLFDTQIAAMVCGFGESVSYQQLVFDILGTQLDKGMRYTDWAKRPLTQAQIEYALSDVTYLRDIYLVLQNKLTELNRGVWFQEEIEGLLKTNLYDPSDSDIAQKIKYNFKGDKLKYLYQDLYLWREKKAKALNRPRRQVVKDELLQELAKAHPTSIEELQNLRGVPASFFKNQTAEELVKFIQSSLKKDKKDFYPLLKEVKAVGSKKILVQMLSLLLEAVAVKEKTSPRVIALQEELHQFVQGDEQVRFLSGWRYDIFGIYALKMRAGELFIHYNPDQQRIEFKKL